MAISDVLSDSSELIRRYLSDHPEMYENVRDDIDDLLKRMDELRAKLDAPPLTFGHQVE